jgi:signal transduction histidine kinase
MLRLLRDRAGDVFLLGLVVWSVAEVCVKIPDSKWISVPFALLWSLPLLARRRSGLAVGLAVTAAAGAATFALDGTEDVNSMYLALLAACAVMGLYEDRTRAVAGGTLAFVVLLTLLNDDPADKGLQAGDVFAAVIFVFGPIACGLAIRERTQRAAELARRTERLERAREEEARLAVAEERAHIARELHDVIAQAIGAMTVQAGAARTRLRDDPARARESIEAVEETGREALAETRRLLGILRKDMSSPSLTPQPGLAALDRLVAAARGEGLTVGVVVEGEPQPLPPGLDLAAYRIVQDGLVQAGSRDGVTRVRVLLRWRPDALEIEIDDDGRVVTDGGADGPVELAAMRERLALYDGTIEARRGSDGVCSVRARLPLGARGVGSTEPPSSGGAGFAGAGAGPT